MTFIPGKHPFVPIEKTALTARMVNSEAGPPGRRPEASRTTSGRQGFDRRVLHFPAYCISLNPRNAASTRSGASICG